MVLGIAPIQFHSSEGLVDDREEEVDEDETHRHHVEEKEEEAHLSSAFSKLREVEFV